jgi:hypothetical protein
MDVLYINELEKFVNEMVISFDVLEPVEKALEKYIAKLRNDSTFLEEQKEYTLHHLKCYQSDILKVVECKGKIKGNWFDFLDKIKLFSNLINFDVFKSENKNTKRTLVKNLYFQVYKCNELTSTNFKETLDALKEQIGETSTMQLPESMSDLPREALDSMGMGSFLNNPALSSIMNSTLKGIKDSGMNPLDMVSQILSGGSNDVLNSLMDSVSKEITDKMASGELDENQLQESLMSSAGNLGNISSLMEQFSGMSGLGNN